MICPMVSFLVSEIRHLNEKLSDFGETLYTTANLELDDSRVTMNNFKIQDGLRPPFLISFLAITQQPIARLQWNFAWKSSFFFQNFANETDTAFHRTYFLFSYNAVNVGFGERRLSCRLLSDILACLHGDKNTARISARKQLRMHSPGVSSINSWLALSFHITSLTYV